MSITSRINEMSTHIEQAYDELQGLGADLTNVNKNIENISMVLDDIYDSLPSVSGEGTSLTLDDTRVGKIKSTLKGNTYQKTTTGKNKASNVWEEYIQSTGTANYKLYPLTLEQGKTYTLSGVLVGTQKTSYYNFGIVKDGDNYNNFVDPHFAVDYNTGNGQQYTFTVDNSFISPKLICYVTSKSVFEELFTNYNIQLEEGSSVTSYEPYTYGASPNPSYPQPINVVSGDNSIEVCGKNLFDLSTLFKNKFGGNTTSDKGITFTNNNGTINFNGTLTGTGTAECIIGVWNGPAPLIELDSSQTYTLKIFGKEKSGNTVVCGVDIRGIKNGSASKIIYGSDNTDTIELTGWSSIVYIDIYTQYTSGAINKNISIQLELGSSATSYEPYQGNTYNIDLPEGMELCKIGNYQDYFYKDSGKWYLHKEIGKVVLNGSESWSLRAFPDNNYLSVKRTLQVGANGGYCDKFISNNNYDIVEEHITLSKQWSECCFAILNSRLSTPDVAGFKTWLGTHNPIVYYVLATPTYTEITDTNLLSQLNELEKAMSKDGQTNISQVNNDLPFIISASALKEWQENTSLNSTLSMVNPLSLGNTLNTQDNTQPIEVDNIEPLEEEENEES